MEPLKAWKYGERIQGKQIMVLEEYIVYYDGGSIYSIKW